MISAPANAIYLTSWHTLTSLLKSCSGVFSVLIANLANVSFSLGTSPTMFKLAQVTPILKKPGLPSTDSANFRPISNLNNISKILERLFLSCLLSHINTSSNFNSFQSAYRPHHSTETALTFTLDNVFHAGDTGSATLLVSLDLSAAFDSINHNILISRLSSCCGLILVWLLTGFPHICITDDSLLKFVMPALPSLI